jgi:hypothetical protein
MNDEPGNADPGTTTDKLKAGLSLRRSSFVDRRSSFIVRRSGSSLIPHPSSLL